MNRSDLIRLARELNTVHSIMPVPVAGKVPIGGKGWNRLPLETRLKFIDHPDCTGIGIQCGLIFHPYYGPVELRCIDADIYDPQKSMLFLGTLQSYFPVAGYRWGRSPATLVFTNPGVIKAEKYGPVQLLGNDKQVVYWGAYINKAPLIGDPAEYRHEGKSIFEQMPPFVPADQLVTSVKASLQVVGFDVTEKKPALDALPLSTADLDTLTPTMVARFQAEIKSMLFEADSSPTGSGRGNKLYAIGLKYGALIKASGNAPSLIDAAESMTSFISFEKSKHAFLADIGRISEEMFDILPGTLGHGDKRDFARGVAASKGLGQQIEVIKAKSTVLLPTGRDYAGQTATDLLKENLTPLRYLVSKFFSDTGCLVFAGKPKIGKGWIVLDLSISIAEGGKFWGQECEQGEVLMYMLEDGKRRIRERMGILRPFGFQGTNNLRFRYSEDGPFSVNSDGTGTLLDDIRKHMVTFPHIRMIVVDVLQRVRGKADRSDNAYQSDYKFVGAIQKLAIEYGILIIVVHHVKKGKVDDAIDSFSGSFGVMGAADGGFAISKEGDVMVVESFMRDTPNFKFELVKESNSPMWKPAETITEMFAPSEGTKTQTVLVALRNAACALKAGDITKRTGINEKNVATYLGRLERSNQIVKASRGYYMAAGVKSRDRIEGVIDVLKRCAKTVATKEVKLQYGPEIAPPDASYMMLTDVAIKEIEAGFADGKDCLTSLKHRGLAVFNSDTLWLIGDKWGPIEPVMVDNPFAIKYPWEK